MNPVFVFFRSAFFGANFPNGHVLLDHRRDEVVQSRLPLSQERPRIGVVFAQVGVVAHGQGFGPGPDVPELKRFC